MEIRTIVNRLCKKYDSRDPYVLADALGVLLLLVPLPADIRGFYQYYRRNHLIYINANLPEETRRIVCAHELGHAVLHKKCNTVFLDRHTYLVTDKYEIEANRFAADLLISDEDVELYQELTIEKLQLLTGFDEGTIWYRFSE